MKRLLAGAALFALQAWPAAAADMPVKAPPLVAAATTYNWTGIYTATGLGGSWWKIDGALALPVNPPLAHTSRASRFDYASMIGAQYQLNNVVLGVEASYNALLSRAYANTPGGTAACLNNVAFLSATCSSRVNNIWTVGGRLGVAWDRFMVFGTGGYASGQVRSQTSNTAIGIIDTTSARHSGWYAGGGFEYFLTRFWFSDVIIGAEYQHIDLGNKFHLSSDGNPNDNRNFRATVDTVRARLVFKWTPAGAVVARY